MWADEVFAVAAVAFFAAVMLLTAWLVMSLG